MTFNSVTPSFPKRSSWETWMGASKIIFSINQSTSQHLLLVPTPHRQQSAHLKISNYCLALEEWCALKRVSVCILFLFVFLWGCFVCITVDDVCTDSWLLFSLNSLMCHDYFQHPMVILGSEHPAISAKAAIGRHPKQSISVHGL